MDYEKVIRVLSEYTDVPIAKISLSTRLDSDLGLNSFDFVTMVCDIESEYNIHIDDDSFNETFSSTYTVGEFIEIIMGYIQ